jgi:hypothetical protein
MKLEYNGIQYHVWRFSSQDPPGEGLSVYDVVDNVTVMEIFRDEHEQKIVFRANGLEVNLDFVELVIGHFDQELGRKFGKKETSD